MADDPKWHGSGYSPEKAWAEIKRKDWESKDEAKRYANRLKPHEIASFVVISVVATFLIIIFFMSLV